MCRGDYSANAFVDHYDEERTGETPPDATFPERGYFCFRTINYIAARRLQMLSSRSLLYEFDA